MQPVSSTAMPVVSMSCKALAIPTLPFPESNSPAAGEMKRRQPIHGQYSDQIFTRFQTNQGVPKKYPLGADANLTRLIPFSRAVPPSPFVSPMRLNDLRPGRAAPELG